jgi:vacuolar-type H+-ATPase subunit E/Vma4
MEELHTTEILDREILEDARKKASRILRDAESAIFTQNSEWEAKTAKSLEDLEKKYKEQCKDSCSRIMARLPMDKRRAKVEKIESLLKSAVDAWAGTINRDNIPNLLCEELAKRIAFSDEFRETEGRHVIYSALEKSEVEQVLKKLNISCPIEEDITIPFPSIIIDAGAVRIISSVQRIIDYYLHVKRTELVEALVGRDFMGDKI